MQSAYCLGRRASLEYVSERRSQFFLELLGSMFTPAFFQLWKESQMVLLSPRTSVKLQHRGNDEPPQGSPAAGIEVVEVYGKRGKVPSWAPCLPGPPPLVGQESTYERLVFGLKELVCFKYYCASPNSLLTVAHSFTGTNEEKQMGGCCCLRRSPRRDQKAGGSAGVPLPQTK